VGQLTGRRFYPFNRCIGDIDGFQVRDISVILLTGVSSLLVRNRVDVVFSVSQRRSFGDCFEMFIDNFL
jgi:hypothetical protein